MSNVDPTLIPTHSELSDEKIEASLRGESSNPVFEVAKKYIDVMRTHDPASTDRRDALVTELILSSPYTLDVLTLIAIWAEGLEDPARSGMSRGFSIPLIAVHTLFDPTNEESVAVVKDYIKTGTIGESAMSDERYIGGARSRLERVFRGLDELSVYIHGVPDAMTAVTQLAISKDPDDKKRLEELLRRGEEKSNPVFSSVAENVTNASMRLGMLLQRHED